MDSLPHYLASFTTKQQKKKLRSQLCKHRKLKLIKEFHCHGFIETFLRFFFSLLCFRQRGANRRDEQKNLREMKIFAFS